MMAVDFRFCFKAVTDILTLCRLVNDGEPALELPL